MSHTVIVEAHYPADADQTFQQARDITEMQDAMRGLAVYRGLPQRDIAEGDTITVDVTFLKLFTAKNHVMHVERLDQAARVIQSREHSKTMRRWDHMLSVRPCATGCIWRDTVVVDAGVATWLAARFCRFVYMRRHRMRNAQSIRSLVLRGDAAAR